MRCQPITLPCWAMARWNPNDESNSSMTNSHQLFHRWWTHLSTSENSSMCPEAIKQKNSKNPKDNILQKLKERIWRHGQQQSCRSICSWYTEKISSCFATKPGMCTVSTRRVTAGICQFQLQHVLLLPIFEDSSDRIKKYLFHRKLFVTKNSTNNKDFRNHLLN